MTKSLIGILVLMLACACDAEETAIAMDTKGKADTTWDGTAFRDVAYKQVGKRELHMDIYLPPDHKSDRVPAIYYVHGGGWAAGSKAGFGSRLMLPVFKQLAAQGFVCVSVDYRLCKKGSGVRMRDCVTDAIDGLRFLNKNHQQYSIDPERIVVFGDSAGGQLAQMLVYASHDQFPGDPDLAGNGVQPIAGISWYGPTDFTDVSLFQTDLPEKNPDRFGARIAGDGANFESNLKAFEEMSPYFWIKEDSAPMLLIQGDTDSTIPLAHATHLKKKAERIGANVELVIVKNAGHNWRKAGGDPTPGLDAIQRLTAEYARQQVASFKK